MVKWPKRAFASIAVFDESKRISIHCILPSFFLLLLVYSNWSWTPWSNCLCIYTYVDCRARLGVIVHPYNWTINDWINSILYENVWYHATNVACCSSIMCAVGCLTQMLRYRCTPYISVYRPIYLLKTFGHCSMSFYMAIAFLSKCRSILATPQSAGRTNEQPPHRYSLIPMNNLQQRFVLCQPKSSYMYIYTNAYKRTHRAYAFHWQQCTATPGIDKHSRRQWTSTAPRMCHWSI